MRMFQSKSAFLSWKKDELVKHRKETEARILNCMVSRLREAGYTSCQSEQLARECLTSTEPSIWCGVDNGPESDEKQPSALMICYNAGENYRKRLDTAHLILNAPRNNTEEKFRDQQATKYMEGIIGGSLNQARQEKNEDMRETVFTRDDIKQAVRSFFKCIGFNALRAYIVFNGHGSENGILLQGEDKPVPIEAFVKDVEGIVEEIQQETRANILKGKTVADPADLQLSTEITIVLAQCHSHLYKGKTESPLRVISLSSSETPKTEYDFNLSNSSSSIHRQLTQFAKKEGLLNKISRIKRHNKRNLGILAGCIPEVTAGPNAERKFPKVKPRDEAEQKCIDFCGDFYPENLIQAAVRKLKGAGKRINMDNLPEMIKEINIEQLFNGLQRDDTEKKAVAFYRDFYTGSMIQAAVRELKVTGRNVNMETLQEMIPKIIRSRLGNDLNKKASDFDVMERDSDSCSSSSEEELEPQNLVEAKKKLKRMIDDLTIKCKLCHDARANILLVPCAHLASCEDCLTKVRRCPIPHCNKVVRGTKEVFFV